MNQRLIRAMLALVATGLQFETAAADPDARDEASESPARLEVPEPSQGHFFAVGAYGVGATAFETLDDNRAPTFGQGFSLRVGQSITEWLDLGLQFAYASTYGKEQDQVTFGRFGVHSQWYFTQKWFIAAGISGGSIAGPDPRDTEYQRGGYGTAYNLGVGRNFFLSDPNQSGGWVLSPAFNLDTYASDDLTGTAAWLGLEVSWWSGLSKDKLDLSVERAYE